MITRTAWLFVPATALALWVGCSGATPSNSATPATATSSGGSVDAGVSMLSNDPDAATAAAADASPPPAAPLPPVAIVAGERREVPTPSPRVRITAPAANATIREDRVEVRLNVTGWRDTANAQDMRHIHLVLDDQPYQRIDDPSRPVVLEHLAQGTHVLRAFPGWETHETVKTDGAFAMVVFHVGAASRDVHFNPRAALLTYSRPKGRIEGPGANRILLDFYVANVPAAQFNATGYRVRATIDGTAMPELTSWVPYYIENLPDGPHTITLDLLGANGERAPGHLNHSEQHITVSRTPAPPAAPTGDAGAPDPHAGH
jgi:hypothetical protein